MNRILFLAFLIASEMCLSSPLPTFKKNPEDFFYAQQTSAWIFYKVPQEVIFQQIGNTLDTLGFALASFEDSSVGYVVVKPMAFMAEFGIQSASVPGTSASTEVELTVLVYPKKKKPASSVGTFEDFLAGRGEKEGGVGQLRLDVLCDDEIAVAAGRKNFGEHKYLGSFEYDYTTPNQTLTAPKPFTMDMTAYTWRGAGQPERKMFRFQVSVKDLQPLTSRFSPEYLFSSFPPEPDANIPTRAVGEYRYFDYRTFVAFVPNDTEIKVDLSFGDVQGAEQLAPIPPFGDGQPIPGSEKWPQDMVARMKGMLPHGKVVGVLVYQSPPAEYETKPFFINP